MNTFDNKSEGKTSIHLPKIMFTNIYFGHIIWRKNLKFLYNNCMYPFLIFVKFCKNYIQQKMQRIEENKKYVSASYLSVLTRFQHRMKLQP